MTDCIYESVIRVLLGGETEGIISYFKQKWVLRTNIKCCRCSTDMKWTRKNFIKDGYVWKCMNVECSHFRSTISIRDDSFIPKS